MTLEEKDIHDGHRARMRAKFVEHGARIFDTYELVEMLLYSVIPVRDTNPIAKRLLAELGGVSGILSATRERLCAVSGIGDKAAALLMALGRAEALGEISDNDRPCERFDDYHRTGRFLTEYFSRESGSDVVMMLLDDTMRLLGLVDSGGVKFGTGALKPQRFVDGALRLGATVAIIAYTHRNGIIFPFDSDVVTCKLIASELSAVGVTLVESYIVDGERYSGGGPRISLRSAPTLELRSFGLTREMGVREDFESYTIHNSLEGAESEAVCAAGVVESYLAELLHSAGISGAERFGRELAKRYGSLDTVLSQSFERLSEIVGERGAHLLRLTSALVSKSMCEGFAFGEAHGDEEIANYVIGAMYGLPVETVLLISLDERGRVRCVDTLGEGTVNASDVYPRKIAECAVRRGAKSVILAHNHPNGVAEASADDVGATSLLFTTCRAAGVRLYRHIIVAGRNHCALEPDVVTGVIGVVNKAP